MAGEPSKEKYIHQGAALPQLAFDQIVLCRQIILEEYSTEAVLFWLILIMLLQRLLILAKRKGPTLIDLNHKINPLFKQSYYHQMALILGLF